jgi:YNFM family putative membrane transporter
LTNINNEEKRQKPLFFASLKNFQLSIIYTCTILTLCTLYAVQPIQPLFEQEFSLSRFEAVIFTTVIMLPLGFAPIFYGYILETLSSKRFVKNAVLLLGFLELLFAMSNSYPLLLGLRALQGLIIPAILTSLMSYIAFITPKDKVQQAMGYYIGATIFGGFIGRLLSGTLSDLFGWRIFFVLLGISLIVMFWLLGYVSEEVKVDFVKPKFSQVMRVLQQKVFLNIYLMMFTVFFVFQAILNFIPFQLQTLSGEMSHGKVGLMYAGYIIGFVISIRILPIIRFWGGEAKTIMAGLFIYLVGIQVFYANSYIVMFLGMFVFCAGFFIIHATSSGFISKMAHENRAISNGLYLSFYYAGGTFGTFAPGVFFQYLGWQTFLIVLTLLAFSTIIFARQIQNFTKNSQHL